MLTSSIILPISEGKKKLIKFPFKQLELSFVASSYKAIHPNSRQPAIESHG